MPEKNIIIIIDGGGCKQGALNWLKNSIQEFKYQNDNSKNIRVFSLMEFITWANKAF